MADATAGPAGDGDAWVDVERRGEVTWAIVYLGGGRTSSRWHVASLAEVADIAARYGIPRRAIRVVPGAFVEE